MNQAKNYLKKKNDRVVKAIKYDGHNDVAVSEMFKGSPFWAIPSPVLEPSEDYPSGKYIQIFGWDFVVNAIEEDWIILEPNNYAVLSEKDFNEKYADKNIEYIIMSAVWVQDGIKYANEYVETGYCVTGRRHHDCLRTIAILTNKARTEHLLVGREGQGFITSHNRFVNREEGYWIAKNAAQLLGPIHDDNPELISEEIFSPVFDH